MHQRQVMHKAGTFLACKCGKGEPRHFTATGRLLSEPFNPAGYGTRHFLECHPECKRQTSLAESFEAAVAEWNTNHGRQKKYHAPVANLRKSRA